MNTLTNIISLIENDPETSIRLIEALSIEFYSMNEISDKKLIPIKQEIRLCNSYLSVMSIRNDVAYEFNLDFDCETLMVPPAIIHTLIENGVTHGDSIDGKVIFTLIAKETKDQIQLDLEVTGGFKKGAQLIEGTGIKYVKSRLEESFSNRWTMKYGATNKTTWNTQIIIYI